jgi:peroxiredoxin (alkyl hydroperoxide reductase subunit C)
MKKLLSLFLLAFSVIQLWSQDISENKIPLIGESAPSFIAVTTNGKINFPSDYGSKWKIILSHPQDFTPVCSSEILELAYAQDDFEKLNTAVFVLSKDPIAQHIQWKKSIEEINYQGRGPITIKFPLIDDEKLLISPKYGMVSTKNVRGVLIIDPDNIIQAIFFYPSNVGRNIEEIKRTLVALQTSKANSVLTPANWQVGKDVLVPLKPETAEAKKGTTDVTWYMTFKKLD